MKKMIMITILLFISTSLFSAQKKALVVGGSSGIGRSLAMKLSKEGYVVGVVARRYDKLQSLLQQAPHKMFIKQVDIASDNARELVLDLIDEMGGVDLCVINAAVFDENHSNKKFDWSQQLSIIEVNVKGCASIINLVAHLFIDQKFGHMITISSVDALRGSAKSPCYSASKAFLSTYAQALRSYCDQNYIPITVTDVLPGHVEVPERDLTGEESWVVPLEKAVDQIYQAGVVGRKKLIYVSKRWYLVGLALIYAPDWLNNYLGGI